MTARGTVDPPAARDPLPQDAAFEGRIAFFERVLREWLDDDRVGIACGSWEDGGIVELVPRRRAQLLPAAYQGCFLGVRELRVAGGEHHMHLDLGRVHTIACAVVPSVCFAFRPSFEVRLLVTGPGGAPTDRASMSLMLLDPYPGGDLDGDVVQRFFERARRHVAERPDLVRVEIASQVRTSGEGATILRCLKDVVAADLADEPAWDVALERLNAGARAAPAELLDPPVLPLLEDALRLREASLVIHRERMLVEFQTEKLAGVERSVHDGHVSWQIGRLDQHHCHLSIGAVASVLFSAEPVPCQGGRLNYTVWFLTAVPCGNPYRRNGYFSVVLNRPYDERGPRREIIAQVIRLFLEHRSAPWVEADATFLDAVAACCETAR